MSLDDHPLFSRLVGRHEDAGHDHDHKDHDHADENEANVLLAKGVTMVVLCTVSTCMGILPMLMAKWFKWNSTGNVNPRSTRLVSMLLGFGGGVLFCTTFLHLLPEVSEGASDLMEEGKLPPLSFSLAETLTCAGFFIMYLVEEAVHTHLRNKQAHKEVDGKKDVNRSTNELVEYGGTISNHTNGHSHANGHSHGNGHSHHLPAIMNSADEDDDFVISSLRGLLIVLGLSIHELFEGLAIGLESSASHVWTMFAAVAAHKFVIAFCIGVELIASNTRRYLSVIYICTFAVVSPLGIGIGMLLVGGGSAAASGPLAVILQGLASGTLLYVVFFEILQEHRTGLTQYLSILVGFILMFGLQMLTAHSHSHGDHGHGGSDKHGEEHRDNNEHETGKMVYSHYRNGESGEGGVIEEAIGRVTEGIADVVSTVLSSSTASSVSSASTAHKHLEGFTEATTLLSTTTA